MVPFQPRERDYAHVGSFTVKFSLPGIGLLAIYDFLKQKLMQNSISECTTPMLASPVLLASENWDDHDRSGRYTALEVAKENHLNLTKANATLFTNVYNGHYLSCCSSMKDKNPILKL